MKKILACPKCKSLDIQSETIRGEPRRHYCMRCRHSSTRISTFYKAKVSTMHTLSFPVSNVHSVAVHHNSDWSGEVIITWSLRPDAEDCQEIKMLGHDLLKGINIPDQVPVAVIARAIALSVSDYFTNRMITAAEDSMIPHMLDKEIAK